jgi:predicted LPLAT superfamily acyltransferase
VADWRQIPEAGTVWGIRFIVGLARLLSRRVAGWFLYLVSLYYVLFRGSVRRASRGYLRRIGQPAGLGNVARHIHTFAKVSLDRLFFLTGRWTPFEIIYHGHELFLAAARSGRGALLLGAHVGSYEVMRSRAELIGAPVNIVVDFSNAGRISSVLRSLAPGIDTRLLPLDKDPLVTVLALKECIERREMVAILADRVSAAERQVVVPFLGDEAPFPAGPWILAHTLKCPVYFFTGLFHPPNRYDLYCEVLADEVTLDGGERSEAIKRHVQRYATVLERHLRTAPMNWFNFFDLWSGR